MKSDHNKEDGFGLLEILIAVGLFAVITTIAVGGFSRALRSQKQAAGLLLANSNISIALEQITRELRTGHSFCADDPPCTQTKLTFRNAKNDIISYLYSENGISRRVGLTGQFQKMTADDVNVRHLDFNYLGFLPGDGLQPRVTIALGVSSREAGIAENVISLQTTVSVRMPLDG